MDRDRIMARIKEFAASPKNVRFAELESLLDKHIGPLFEDYNHHGSPHHSFTVRGQTFTISEPRRGCVKKPYIDLFLDAMEVVGLFDAEAP